VLDFLLRRLNENDIFLSVFRQIDHAMCDRIRNKTNRCGIILVIFALESQACWNSAAELEEQAGLFSVEMSSQKGVVWRRALGRAISFAGATGVLACLLCLMALPFMAGWGGAKAKEMLAATSQRVQSLADSIRLAGQSLEQAANTLEDSTTTLDTIQNTLRASGPLLNSIEVLIGENLPTTIEVTNQALISAQASAQAIDRVLRALDALSLITGVTYKPEKPLDESLAEIADGLSPLPDALRDSQADLASMVDRLEKVTPTLVDAQDEFGLLAETLRRMGDSISEESDALEAFADILSGAASQALGWMRGLAAVLALVIIWLGLGQAAIFYLGEQLRRESVFIS
jgi:hypothetical protein